MKKVAMFGILGLLLVSLVASGFAFSGKGLGNEAAREALKAGDYATWKEAMNAELTEERFNQMVERHQMKQERMAEMEQAMEQGYEAWKQAVSDSPRGVHITGVITEDNFDTFVEIHEARKSGDIETAKELAEELGLERPAKGYGFGKSGMRCGKG